MTTYNTIILLHNSASLTRQEYKHFEEGNLIFGNDVHPAELKRWSIEQESEAKKELAKHECSYEKGANLVFIEEYALEYCLTDEDGEFLEGSDFDLANKAINEDDENDD